MKLFRLVLGLLAVGLISFRIDSAAAGEVIGTFGLLTIEARHMPTPELPGHTTWRLSAASNLDIRAFDFAGARDGQPGDPDVYGFFGPMAHVNPAGQSTVFDRDFDHPFCLITPDCGRPRDSHFLIGQFPVVVPATFASESPDHLRAVYANSVPFPNPIDFAQLVQSNTAAQPIHFRGVVAVGPLDNLQEITVFGTLPPIPEPASVVLAGLAAISWLFVRRAG